MMKKIGRNDPCPCGSGKKYKQCCGKVNTTQTLRASTLNAQVSQAIQAALMFRSQGNLSKAETICHQIIQAAPKNADALNLLGTLLMQDGRFDEADKYINQAIRYNSRNPEFYSNLGLSMHERGLLDEAKKNYRKAISLHPEYTDAYYNLHALLLNQDDTLPAIQCLRKVVEINPVDTDARYQLGVLLDYSGEATEAEKHFGVVSSAENKFSEQLDAWHYIKSSQKILPRLTGSNMQAFELALSMANIEGLVLEFGVRFGTSIRQIAGLVSQQVHGFDSFEGLPEIWHHEPKGSYTTRGVIPEMPENVTLHKGWFEDTLPIFLENNLKQIRFINIDCDIYSSTATVLQQLAPYVVLGTVIIFDEYIGNEHWREDEYKAFQEAVEKYNWHYEYISVSVFTKQVGVIITKV